MQGTLEGRAACRAQKGLEELLRRWQGVSSVGNAQMKREICRREFLNGVLVSSAALVLGCHKRTDTESLGDTADTDIGGVEITAHDGRNDHSVCHRIWQGEAWDIPEATGELLDCVVVGGGLAGLVSAWRVKKAGHGVLLLEKNAVVGGQARQQDFETTPAAMASAFTDFPYNAQLTELYDDIGIVTGYTPGGHPIIDEAVLVSPPYDSFFIDGAWYSSPFEDEASLRALPFSDAIKADLRAFKRDMIRWYSYWGSDDKGAFEIPFDEYTSTDAAVRELDTLTFTEYVTGKGWDVQVADLFSSLIRSEFGTTPEEVSAYAAICNISPEVFPSEGGDVISLPGGNAHIALALADLLGESVLAEATVLQVRRAGEEVHVTYRRGETHITVRARTIIYAAPQFLAPYVVPELAEAGRGDTSFLKYAPYIVANVHVSRTPQELVWISQIEGDYAISDIIVADWAGLEDPAAADPGRPNVLTIYMPLTHEGARMELLSRPIDEYQELMFAELEEFIPGITEAITRLDLYRWGHPMVIATPGFVFGSERIASKEPLGPIFFAGHETEGLPIIDCAIASGYRAAREAGGLLG